MWGVGALVLRMLIQCNGPDDYCGPEGDANYDTAVELSLGCRTSTAWIERAPDGNWIAVCGDDNGAPTCLPVAMPEEWPAMPACK